MAGCEKLEEVKEQLPPPPSAKSEEESASSEPDPASMEAPVKEEFETLPIENPVIIKNEKTLIEDFDPAEGTELILSFSYDTPKVYIEGRDEAAAKINEFTGLLSEKYYSGNAGADMDIYSPVGYDIMLQEATDNFTYYYENNAEGISLEYSSTQDCSVSRADKNILSIVLHSQSYSGGAHGSYADYGYVFDTESGENLSLQDLSEDYEALSAYLIDKMVELAEKDEDQYYSQRIVFVTHDEYANAFRNLLRNGSWYFDSEGLVIFTLTEEFGPHAAGIVEFRIPYEELEGKIYDKYIPKSSGGKGKFEISALSELSDGSIEIIDKLTADEEGQELCLIAKGNVYDVSITKVSYANRFYELGQLWYCSEMGSNALQLKAVIPEGVPDLMLKYRDAEGMEYRYLISQSGKDGSFILVNDDIEAVG